MACLGLGNLLLGLLSKKKGYIIAIFWDFDDGGSYFFPHNLFGLFYKFQFYPKSASTAINIYSYDWYVILHRNVN